MTTAVIGLTAALGALLPATAQAAADTSPLRPVQAATSANSVTNRSSSVPGFASAAGTRAADTVDVCGAATPGFARCLAQVRTDVHGGTGPRGRAARTAAGADPADLPDGLSPSDLHAAYQLPLTGGDDQTVAIVDAGSYAGAESDLAVYRATYGLPACTTANGCFRQVDQRGQATPQPDEGWGIEIALDLDMVSAACPSCHILLVGADSPAVGDLAASVDTAVALGADEVSNSYGATEYNGVAAHAADYAHPGVAILASSGDSGYTVPSVPAVYTSVIAVGGTSLSRSAGARGWTETAWSRAGSGCSAWIDKPAWQTDENCPGRTTADVSAVADPQTGPAVYFTNPNGGGGGHVAATAIDPGWTIVGGTSASSPFLAGVIGLAGNPGRYPDASSFYTHAADLNDVVGGANGPDCGGDYQCNAVPGYDGPTGNGTPRGIAAF
ncbi:S53 family peptidase [Actinacidiphila acidipaludis]|uniref:Peptidase S8 n=1 Tax=Actinacidiphila acidipaludis TaxID=2873382 RepID=A0ABS7QE85_9ACTN|nr:peptidase S8 [Streptomyces acidipaludis]MBY8881481.1 peptidase S8 [Streptomyces acidipaludis]